jgi:YVTN family beta-propeller protein
VTRIDVPGPGEAISVSAPVAVGDGPVDVAVGEDALWVANSLGRSVTKIDPATGKVVATIKLGNEPQRVAADAGKVWVTVRAPEKAETAS